ncbi:mandelate racemase/muconate lactonizing enzyme family protein [Amycolatopsis sp. cmx-4-68]|uniref:mandelate racemase/muconate lactonizing enzyme family protein n=1 Tax=Amycolatopsis sp. cmx-4-68 TaxID=2790938 RepID=UPI00397C9AFA
MRIADLRVYRCRVPLRSPYASMAVPLTDEASVLLVELVTDTGERGWGEAAPISWLGETPAGAEAALSGPLRRTLTGRDLADFDELLGAAEQAAPGEMAALAGVDLALHDLLGRQRGTPLHRLLGAGEGDGELTTCMTLGLGPLEAMKARVAECVAEGFTILKLKVGTDVDEDLDRVRAVRAAAGTGVRLWLDANGRWTPGTAIRVLGRMADEGLDIELVEQPVPAKDLAGLAEVRRGVRPLVVADESVVREQDAVDVVTREAADVLNVKLHKNGGIRAVRRIIDVAERAGITCMIGCTLETTVSATAAAAVAAASGRVAFVDLDAPLWLRDSPVIGGAVYAGPRIRLPEAAGLGIEGPARKLVPCAG